MLFLLHNHIDHIGLISYIPVYSLCWKRQIYVYTIYYVILQEWKIICIFNIIDRETYYYKDIIITPYVVDHSAYNSLMFLIESEGKNLLHTGDFRNHGYKEIYFYKTLEKIGKIDALITEGTSFSRENQNITEAELSNKATESMKKYNQVFILQSSGTNIDRITSMYKSC